MRDTLKRWSNNGFSIVTWDTHKIDSLGKSIIGYTLRDKGKIIFTGEDFHCSPMHAIDGLETIEAILSFLTLKIGDTDREYFEDYAPEQLEWSSSSRCDELQMIRMMMQERLEKQAR
jgi:hypothetical protein